MIRGRPAKATELIPVVSSPLEMAMQRTHSMSYECASSFRTKEGAYKKGSFQYLRETKKAHTGKELSPVTVSFVSCKDKDGSKEWITFNSAKEYYFYPFYGMRKFPDLSKPEDKRTYRAPTIPVCHDFNLMTRSTDRLDLIIGFSTGPLQYVNPISHRSLTAFNDDCSIDKTRVTCVKWVPGSESMFVSSHRSGHLYVWTTTSAGKGTGPINFQPHSEIQDAVISTVKTKHKSPLLFRWSIGHGPINSFAFSPDSEHIAVASQDGFMRIYHFKSREFHSRMRSYFGGILCLCWSPDGCYVVTGGEDDLVTVWSFHHKRVVARGVGHQSYVSAVAFDPYTTVLPEVLFDAVSSPTQEDTSSVALSETCRGSIKLRNSGAFDAASTASSPFLGRLASDAGREKEVVAYRLGSVGQDSLLCLWDLSEDALKIRRPFSRSRSSRLSRMMSSHQQQGQSGETSSLRQRANTHEKTNEKGDKNIGRSQSDTLDQNLDKATDTLAQEGTNPHLADQTHADTHVESPSTVVEADRLETGKMENKGEGEQKRKSNSQSRESQEKEASPAVSDASSGERKNGKKTKDKGGKNRGQPKSLRDPMKRVMKLVRIGGQHQNNRREVSAFETCNSDDIAPKMDEVNTIEPLVVEQMDKERLSDLVFREDCIILASFDGRVSMWARPGVEENVEERGGEVGEEETGSSQQPPGAVSSDKPPETHPGLNSPRPGGGPNSPLKQTTV